MTGLHPAVRDRLARLSLDQRAAATAPRGPVLCVAPAGSGKTTTLVARICWLVDGGVSPSTLAAVTFNRRAADELAVRVDEALAPLGAAPSAVRIRTFHALGREILLDAGVDVGRLADRAELLRELLGPSADPAVLRRLDDAFSRLKLDPTAATGAAAIGPELTHAFHRYQAALTERGALDFDDLVSRALAALRDDASLLARWREASTSLLVDEVQDLDRSQLEMALLLAGPSPDLFLVGDDDQTIYAWRLADVRRVLSLAARLPDLRRHDLITNRRCPPEVVRRASRLIGHNRERFQKRIEPSPSARGVIRLAADPGDEVTRARRLLRGWFVGGAGSHAILARTNAALAPYAAVAVELGIPYRAVDDGLMLDHPTVDALLAELPSEAVAGVAGEAPRSGASPKAVPLLAWLAGRVASLPAERRPAGIALLSWAAPFRTSARLREAVARAREARAALRRDDAVLVLATAHGTKGLEFDHVACVGLDDGSFPSRRSLDEATDPARALEEERRLAYVAWTRARRSLTLVYDPATPSLFLREAFDAQELDPRRGQRPRCSAPADAQRLMLSA